MALAVSGCRRDDGSVRMTPLVGSRPWFGPRRYGWGLTPVAPAGWVATGVLAALAVNAARHHPDDWKRPTLLVTAFTLLAVLTGTAPGGPRARRAFDESRAAVPEN
jgi:hypothetical protein